MTDNPKVKIEDTKFGKGLVATEWIKKGEFIGSFKGVIYKAKQAMLLPPEAINHAMQVSEEEYSLPKNSMIIYANHSCEPNCGIRGVYDIVAMRDINIGEKITWDYEMSEDSDWRMKCLCGEPNCRGEIGAFKNMPLETREKYGDYISDWLIKKYSLKT